MKEILLFPVPVLPGLNARDAYLHNGLLGNNCVLRDSETRTMAPGTGYHSTRKIEPRRDNRNAEPGWYVLALVVNAPESGQFE